MMLSSCPEYFFYFFIFLYQAMELLTKDMSQSTPEVHRDLVNVVRQTALR
jgi:hypothetical protein